MPVFRHFAVSAAALTPMVLLFLYRFVGTLLGRRISTGQINVDDMPVGAARLWNLVICVVIFLLVYIWYMRSIQENVIAKHYPILLFLLSAFSYMVSVPALFTALQ